MIEKVISQVTFEIEQIDRLLESYAGLLERAQNETPNQVEIAALASVLHSFYNGLENIFLTIEPLAKLIYNKFDILYIVRVSFLCTI